MWISVCLSWLALIVSFPAAAEKKRDPRDPAAVVGTGWKVSHWAVSKAWLDRFEMPESQGQLFQLPEPILAMELRVGWDQRFVNYSCEVNVYYKPELRLALPKGTEGHYLTGPDGLDGVRARSAEDRRRAVSSDEFPLIGGIGELSNLKPSGQRDALAGGLQMMRFRKLYKDGISFVAMKANCIALGDPRAVVNEVWLRKEGAGGEAAIAANPKGRERTGSEEKNFFRVELPSDLAARAYPYWKRATDINLCYSDDDSFSRHKGRNWRPGYNEERIRRCAELRESPIQPTSSN